MGELLVYQRVYIHVCVCVRETIIYVVYSCVNLSNEKANVENDYKKHKTRLGILGSFIAFVPDLSIPYHNVGLYITSLSTWNSDLMIRLL